jgi:Peptidase family M28
MKTMKILTFILILFFTFLSLFQLNPPATTSINTPVQEFSSARAMKHLQIIAQKPHPIGSLENAKVRDYIVKQLKILGLSPEIQQTTVVNQKWGVPYIGGTVQNVLARLKGTENKKAILITAHYDSVANGPGASDDGAAVAAMLETIRALKASTHLKNDIIFLFSDGEEVGLLGAKAFVDEHPWAKDVGVTFNFEARGNSGSTVMFETSDNNGQLIKEFASAAVHPVTSSLFNSVYKLLPNDTDFSIYKEAGIAGLNFAYMSGVVYYHTFFDNLKTIDERSLQHQGAYALSLARHFGNLDIEDIKNLKTRDAVYFDILGLVLIHYEQNLVIFLTITGILLFIAIAVLGLRKKQLTVRGITLGFLAQLISIISSAVIVTLTWLAITNSHTEYQSILQGDTYNSNFYMIAFVALAIAISSQIYLLFSKQVSLQNLAIGSLLWWLLLMVLSNLYLPGASYLFTFPLLFTLIGLGIIFASISQNNIWRKNFNVILAICSIPAIVLLAPTIYLTFIALTLEMSGIVVVLVSLLVGLLIPLLFVIATPKKRLLPIGALLISISFIIAGSWTANFDANHPKPNSVFYAFNADTKQAIWASADRQPDEWTSQFFSTKTEKVKLPEYLPLTSFNFLTAPAPIASIPAPSIEIISNEVRDGIQTLNLRVISPRQGRVVNIYLNPKIKVLAAAVNNKKISSNSDKSWALSYYALPKVGIELTLQIQKSSLLNLKNINFKLVDKTDGLPQITGNYFQPRPNDMMPTTFGQEVNDSTLVRKTFNL